MWLTTSKLPLPLNIPRRLRIGTIVQSLKVAAMAASISRLAGHSAKRLCLRPALSKSTSRTRPFSALSTRQYAQKVRYEATRLIPTDEAFAPPTNPNDPQHMNYTPDSNLESHAGGKGEEGIENRKIRHYTVNFGPQHPAAHGVLRLILELNG